MTPTAPSLQNRLRRPRYSQPAERPVVCSGHVAGRDEERLPLCVDCLQLLLEDVRRFWDGMSRGRR